MCEYVCACVETVSFDSYSEIDSCSLMQSAKDYSVTRYMRTYIYMYAYTQRPFMEEWKSERR